jgi:hypothetical protein
MAHACNPSYSGGRDQEDHCLKPARANSWRPFFEKTQHKKGAGGVTQAIERLPSKHETLSSKPSNVKTKQKSLPD